ncbi:PadR family transcriptional regulator [Halosegnis marinus]|uniref:PadR family transcriptional regulator n=1 Tax=Halosegnis marinus TaxID=3034023 RepID=A0ABD5ZRS8_9EURY|nr:PadR family transcriptional regulator [Halosegnis sp. DT85]
MEWFASGMRRDVCLLLYGEERKVQKLKTALGRRYDRRVRPKQFDGAIRALEEAGHVERRTEGIADVLALTERGERGVETQYEFFRERVAGSGE